MLAWDRKAVFPIGDYIVEAPVCAYGVAWPPPRRWPGACGGCSISSPAFDSLFGRLGHDTSSITPPPGSKETAELPPEHDLAFARAAASEVLTRGVKGASQPWENPATGARGTVTPVASAYTQDGQTCRDFLASYITPE